MQPDYEYTLWSERQKKKKKYWVSNKRFLAIFIFIILMWVWLMVFFYLKADEVTKHPCQVCSEAHGTNVVCTTSDILPVSRTYYPNGTIVDTNPHIRRELKDLPNFTSILNISKS